MEETQHNPGAPVFEIELLFENCPEEAGREAIEKALSERLDSAAWAEDAYTVGKYPARICVDPPSPFDPSCISDFTRGQMWNVPQANQLLARCTHHVRLSDQNAQGLDYKARGDLIVQMTEAVFACYPDCVAVYTPAAGRLLTAEQMRSNPSRGGDRFLYLCVNTRFFSVSGTEGDMMIDTVGLSQIGLPDLQYHFHSLNPNALMKHAYSVASLLYAVGPMMKSGETIDGMDNYGISQEIRWPVQYQHGLIEPPRIVMAITPGEYAVP